jgi:hypothetical protein
VKSAHGEADTISGPFAAAWGRPVWQPASATPTAADIAAIERTPFLSAMVQSPLRVARRLSFNSKDAPLDSATHGNLGRDPLVVTVQARDVIDEQHFGW